MGKIYQIAEAVDKILFYYPELRVCQILTIAAEETGWDDEDLFYLTDDRLLEGIEMFIKSLGVENE